MKTDRTKILLAGIVSATIVAVTLAVLVIPRKHVVVDQTGEPWPSEPEVREALRRNEGEWDEHLSELEGRLSEPLPEDRAPADDRRAARPR